MVDAQREGGQVSGIAKQLSRTGSPRAGWVSRFANPAPGCPEANVTTTVHKPQVPSPPKVGVR
jgi:hypothetical protein